MRKRAALLVFLPLVLLGIGLLLPVLLDREPAYMGYRLRTWVEVLGCLDLRQRAPRGLPHWTRDDIYFAVKHTGTNAFPYLLNWISYDDRSARAEIAALVRRFFTSRPTRPKAEIRAFGAARAIQYLEEGATPLIPDLVQLMNDPARPDTAERVMDTLAYVGTNGLPPLIAFLNNPAHPHRGSAAVAMSAVCKLGPNARPAIPALVQCVQDPDPNLAARAASTLGILALEPASVVPALKGALYSSDPAVRACSAGALIAFREQAPDTLPALTNLLTDPQRSVRAAASNAIFHIHTSAATVVLTNAPAQ